VSIKITTSQCMGSEGGCQSPEKEYLRCFNRKQETRNWKQKEVANRQSLENDELGCFNGN